MPINCRYGEMPAQVLKTYCSKAHCSFQRLHRTGRVGRGRQSIPDEAEFNLVHSVFICPAGLEDSPASLAEKEGYMSPAFLLIVVTKTRH